MIHELLTTGADNAKTGKELCKILNLKPRDITLIVERERREGKPICASSNGNNPGYYLAATQEEMQSYCKSLFHRAGEIHKTRRACLKAAENLPHGEGLINE